MLTQTVCRLHQINYLSLQSVAGCLARRYLQMPNSFTSKLKAFNSGRLDLRRFSSAPHAKDPSPHTGLAATEAPATSETIFSEEILEALTPVRGEIYLDLTFGSGGHTRKILECDPTVKVIAVDRDPNTIHAADELKKRFTGRLCYLNIKFSDVVEALASVGVAPNTLSGAVLDAGPSLAQLYDPNRGFANSSTHRIDMRMDGPSSATPSALDVLRYIDEESLYRVLKCYGGVRNGRLLARAIVQSRYEMVDINTPAELIILLKTVLCLDTSEFDKEDEDDTSVHGAAAKVFQALRVLVNDEINELDCGIRSLHCMLRDEATLAVVSYNLLEDTVVKRHFAGMNIDASPSTIGRPQHRNAKLVGMTDHRDCRPWKPLDKHKLLSDWAMVAPHKHWKSAKLRTALKNPDVAYDC